MKIETASVLAFERNLDISDGWFYQKGSENKSDAIPVVIREKSVRGTISNRLKKPIADDPLKLDAEIEKANLQKVDVAALDHDKNTLVVEWSCKVLPFTGKPYVCNNQAYQSRLIQVVQDYIHENGFSELARRYAMNIANARWLWRNRVSAKKVTVSVSCELQKEKVELSFDALNINLNYFSSEDKSINKLSQLVEMGLKGEQFIILDITAHAEMGYGQEIYPSQELILDSKDKKSKVLYQINQTAGIHSQKIGNAIRTVDTWYMDDAKFPIAVEPYGSVTTMGHAFRQPKDGIDFYTLFDHWVLNNGKPTLEQQHFVMAVLIRGGVFGKAEDKEGKKKKDKEEK